MIDMCINWIQFSLIDYIFCFQRFIQQIDKTQSGDISLNDFVSYVRDHENNLKQHFASLDRNRDGKYILSTSFLDR